jgi:hypothetical protein
MFSSCSLTRKLAVSEEPGRSGKNVSLENVRNKNLTDKGFFISKAEISVTGKDMNEKVLCSIKYNVPGKYLITLRSRSGIEAARLLITEDTVLMNDRINRKLYYGSGKSLQIKYGFSDLMIPVIFGDYIGKDESNEGFVNCLEGFLRKRAEIGSTVVDYIIDCRKEKPVKASAGNNELNIDFRSFRKIGESMIPGEIEIVDSYRRIKVMLKIDKIEYPWEGSIDFVPGSNYERIPLI